MKHKNNYFGYWRIPMANLQLFADGDGDGGDGANGDGTGADTNGDNNEPPSFDDFLKQEGNQAEFDRRVQKAIDTAIGNAQKKWQKDAADKASEAEKLAKMNAEQKQQYALEKLQKENEELKAEAAKNELGRSASSILVERGIDATQEILDFVVGVDAQDTNERIDKFVKIVEEQLKKAEIARATGTTPKVVTNAGNQMSEFDKRIAKYK